MVARTTGRDQTSQGQRRIRSRIGLKRRARVGDVESDAAKQLLKGITDTKRQAAHRRHDRKPLVAQVIGERRRQRR